jgi:hypothetical protein
MSKSLIDFYEKNNKCIFCNAKLEMRAKFIDYIQSIFCGYCIVDGTYRFHCSHEGRAQFIVKIEYENYILRFIDGNLSLSSFNEFISSRSISTKIIEYKTNDHDLFKFNNKEDLRKFVKRLLDDSLLI